ncbi:MAG: dihydropteroate synthase-like protein [Candidatus Hadarchaeales archaeon]
MRVLLLTGRLASSLVRKYSKVEGVEAEVVVAPVPVATFLTPSLAVRELEKKGTKGYDLVLLPGMVRFDPSEVERRIGIPTYRGPKHAADLPLVLEKLGEVELSKEVPACELLREEARKRAERLLKEVERKAEENPGEGAFLLDGLGIGGSFPPRVMAEIVDAPLLPQEEVLERARRYLEEGAEILDVGMVAGRSFPERAGELISLLKKEFGVPVSIDTFNLEEISRAVEEGADLVLSLDRSSLRKFDKTGTAVVLVPPRVERGKRKRELLDLVEEARKRGFEKVVADPLLEPLNLGFLDSVRVLAEVREERPELPLLMGVGNVVELCDADSPGMMALLAGMGMEIGVSLFLTAEASDKTRGSVGELRRARDMMLLARERGSVPKDLGLDLLFFKEKRKREEPYDPSPEAGAKVLEEKPMETPLRLGGSFFRIRVEGGEIRAVLYRGKRAEVVFRGKSAEGLCRRILEEGITDPFHAAYLGRELQKAEIALKTGRSYVQEGELF